MPFLAIASVVAFWVFLATGAGLAAKERVTDREYFELGAGCSPMALQVHVSHTSTPIRASPPTKAEVTAAVRSRLRAAGLYTDESWRFMLFVSVRTTGYAVALHLRFYKLFGETSPLFDKGQYTGAAITHLELWVGQYEGGDTYITGGLARLMDKFIDDYLRVNAAACKLGK